MEGGEGCLQESSVRYPGYCTWALWNSIKLSKMPSSIATAASFARLVEKT